MTALFFPEWTNGFIADAFINESVSFCPNSSLLLIPERSTVLTSTSPPAYSLLYGCKFANLLYPLHYLRCWDKLFFLHHVLPSWTYFRPPPLVTSKNLSSLIVSRLMLNLERPLSFRILANFFKWLPFEVIAMSLISSISAMRLTNDSMPFLTRGSPPVRLSYLCQGLSHA